MFCSISKDSCSGLEMSLLWITLSLHLSASLLSGLLIPEDKTTRIPENKDPEEGAVLLLKEERQQRSHYAPDTYQPKFATKEEGECQEGNPPGHGVPYTGTINVTASGIACDFWTDDRHNGWYGHVGDHNYCRNPYRRQDEGVWCFTGYYSYLCDVPVCVSSMKVLDFSADNDNKPDSDGEYTSACLEGGALPESFTICMAFMLDAWTTSSISAKMFVLLDPDFRDEYGSVSIDSNSYYTVEFGNMKTGVRQSETLYFPLQWTHVCFSLDSNASKVILVVDGHLLIEQEYTWDEIKYRPYNLSLLLGSTAWSMVDDPRIEHPVKIADFNVFKSSSVERMVGLTKAGHEECGAPGDLVSWEEAEWTLHSQAKVVEVGREWEGPCRRESKVQVFTADFEKHHDCMYHCEKIAGGRSPPVITEEEWMNLKTEVDLITEDRSILPYMWPSAMQPKENNHS